MAAVTPALLCGEFGVSYQEMYKSMVALKIGVTRMGAQLNAAQAHRLRTYWQNVARLEARRAKQRERARETAAAQAATAAPATPPADSTVAHMPAQRAVEKLPKMCACCERRFMMAVLVGDQPWQRPLCPDCEPHDARPGEDLARRLARAESHAQLYRTDRERAYEAVARMDRDKQGAYDSRASWRNALVEVVLDHDEGRGACAGAERSTRAGPGRGCRRRTRGSTGGSSCGRHGLTAASRSTCAATGVGARRSTCSPRMPRPRPSHCRRARRSPHRPCLGRPTCGRCRIWSTCATAPRRPRARSCRRLRAHCRRER